WRMVDIDLDIGRAALANYHVLVNLQRGSCCSRCCVLLRHRPDWIPECQCASEGRCASHAVQRASGDMHFVGHNHSSWAQQSASIYRITASKTTDSTSPRPLPSMP